MPISELVMIALMAFVLLAPTLMVAVLISGVSRRPAPRVVKAVRVEVPAEHAAPAYRAG